MKYHVWADLNDASPLTVTLAATGNVLCQLRSDGSVHRYHGPGKAWEQIGDSPACIAIVTDGDLVYQLHDNGSVYRYDFAAASPSWLLVGDDAATIAVVAADGGLATLTRDGSIYLYGGTPFDWLRIDDNAATVAIAAAGYHLYQLHRDGAIWEYNGTPLTGWLLLDANPATVAISCFGDDLYQLHNDGSIWLFDRYGGDTWTMIGDPNGGVAYAIAAGDRSVVQLHRTTDNGLFLYTGTPHTGWQWIDDSSLPYRAVICGTPQPGQGVSPDEQTPTGIYAVYGNGTMAEYMGLHDE